MKLNKKSLLACFQPKTFEAARRQPRALLLYSVGSPVPSCQLAVGQVPSRELAVLAHLQASALAARAFDLAPARTHWLPSLSLSVSLQLPFSISLYLLSFSLPPSLALLARCKSISSLRIALHLISFESRVARPDQTELSQSVPAGWTVGLWDCGTVGLAICHCNIKVQF